MSFWKVLFFGIILLSLVLVMPPVFADTWYTGKGLKQGDFFRYNVCSSDYHNCAPLEIDFWVQNQTSDGNWNLQFLALEGNVSQAGVVTISSITPDPINYSSNLSEYSTVYRYTIAWLDFYANKERPKDFTALAWGSGSGVVLLPKSQQQITIKAGTFNAWLIDSEPSFNNSEIWVDPTLPFPIKTTIYKNDNSFKLAISSELLETGNSKTEPTWNLSPTSTVPEFPFASIILALSIISMIILYQFKFMSRGL